MDNSRGVVMKDNKKKIITSIITIIVLILAAGIIIANYVVAPFVSDVEISDSKRFEDKVVFNVKVKNLIKDMHVPDIASILDGIWF